MTDRLRYERAAIAQGYTQIAGMDEAGRGPLAGPVVVACVALPLDAPIDGVDDSKKLSPAKREKLYALIRSRSLSIGLGQVDAEEIDALNILEATRRAMEQAVRAMCPPAPDLVLVDAVTGLDLPMAQQAIVGGDRLSYLIGAASIVAKVTRDAQMAAWDAVYPGYGFARNKGYGTAEHIAALRRLGPCPLHRRSFISHLL